MNSKVCAQRPSIEAVGECYSVAHGFLSLNEVTKDHDIFYCRSEFLQPELMLGYLLKSKNVIPQPQLLQCIVVRRFSFECFT